MKRLSSIIILIYIGACSCNVTEIEQKTLEEEQDKINFLINGKQWLDYFGKDDVVESYNTSHISYSGGDANSDEIYLAVGWYLYLSNKFREYISIGFVFPKEYDFNKLQIPYEVDYILDNTKYPEEFKYSEIDYDVGIGYWDRYDSNSTVKATLTYFNYAKRIVEVKFEGTLMLDKHMADNPYPGRLWPDTLRIKEGLIRSKFRDIRVGE